MFALLFIAGSALLLAFIKTCDPDRARSVYYRTKGRRE